MRMIDLINKKRDCGELNAGEIHFFIEGVVSGSIPDYQTAAMLMAIYLNGMTAGETAALTREMTCSGDVMDLSQIKGIKVDKHSTGGVGDKTTLVVAPIVASYGVPVAKMSGRGLGHTGGTVDKLESIPGLKTEIDRETFFKIVNETGICVIGQSGNIVPADKKLYALRDVTGTIGNISLLSSSIMSKKLAAGSDAILLDVKIGSGAFMKTVEEGIALAEAMVEIGRSNGKKMAALITNMDIPLGHAIGNSLEVIEAVETLRGQGPEDLTEICLSLAGNMLFLAEKGSLTECMKLAEAAMKNGNALKKLREMVVAQGGDGSYIDNVEKFPSAAISHEVKCRQGGYIEHINTEKYGNAAVILGAGRTAKEDKIDFSAGIIIKKKTGEAVAEGDVLAVLYTSKANLAAEAEKEIFSAITIGKTAPKRKALIYERIGGK